MNRLTPIAFAVATLLAATPVLAAVDVPLGDVFRIESASPFPHFFQDPVVARARDGAIVAAWGTQGDDGVPRIAMQRLATDGAPLGPVSEVARLNAKLGRSDFDLAVDDAGVAVVVWRDGDPDRDEWRLLLRRYAPDGTVLGEPMLVEQVAGGEVLGRPAIAADADGDVVIAWERGHVGRDLNTPVLRLRLGQRQVRLRRYGRDGQAAGDAEVAAARADLLLQAGAAVGYIGGPAVMVGASTRLLDSVDVAVDEDGDHIVVWGGESDVGVYAVIDFFSLPYAYTAIDSTTIFARRYGADGRPLERLPTVVDSASTVELIGRSSDRLGGPLLGAVNGPPSVAMQRDGSHLVAWTRQRIAPLRDREPDVVVAQRYGASGERLPELAASREPAVTPVRLSRVAVAAAGADYVLAWGSAFASSRFDRASVDAVRVSAAHRAGRVDEVGTRLSVAPREPSGYGESTPPSVAVDGLGNPVFMWLAYDPPTQGISRLFGRLYTRP